MVFFYYEHFKTYSTYFTYLFIIKDDPEVVKTDGFEIVKQRVQFKNQIEGSSQLYDEDQQLEDLKPKDVFAELVKVGIFHMGIEFILLLFT